MPGVPETFPPAPPTPQHIRNVLLWDGSCGFCARCAAWFRRIMLVEVGVRPVQDVLAELPQIVAATAKDQVLWIDAEGRAFGGVEAISRSLRAAGHPIGAWLVGNRSVRSLAVWVYRKTAESRKPTCSSTR